MHFEPNITEEEKLEEEARKIADIPPERIAGTEELPDDVFDGEIDDDNLAGADDDEE